MKYILILEQYENTRRIYGKLRNHTYIYKSKLVIGGHKHGAWLASFSGLATVTLQNVSRYLGMQL
jgi:hypothetical protein